MSECVVRMEMPLNCLECPMYDYNRHKLCCNAHFDLRPIPNGGVPKPDWCPILCQLPEGHGRLVDAGAKIYVMQVPVTVDDASWIVHALPTIVPATNTPTDTPTDTPTVPAERSET